MQWEPYDKRELPDVLPTSGRTLAKAAAVYDFVQPIVTLGQERRLNAAVVEIVPLKEEQSVLDVGCGTGLLTGAIAARYPSAQVIGIDASKPMIRVARRKRTAPNCRYRQAVAEALPFGDREFDVVVSALFFHHVNAGTKRLCLSEAWRVLKPGGRLIVADIDRPYSPLGWLMATAGWILLMQPEIKENIDGILRRLIEETGFKNVKQLGQYSGYISVLSARRTELC